MIFHDELSWSDHKLIAQDMGMNLASIHSQSEQDEIMAMLESEDVSVVFIGGFRDEWNQDVWYWSDSSPWGIYQNWEIGQPNNNGGFEGCVALMTGRDSTWHDYSCFDSLPAIYRMVSPQT